VWRRPTETNYGGPVIGRDGTIYQGTFAGRLLAFRPDGTQKWAYQAGSIVESTPALLHDGRIAFVDNGGTLTVLKPDGTLSWRFGTGTLGCCPEPSPAIGRDGTIYTAIYDTAYSIHPDGRLRWRYNTGRVITGSVSVTSDGVVYVLAAYLFALGPDGTLLWQGNVRALGGAPAIGMDGTIYVNSLNPEFYAFNPDGTIKWSYQAGDCCGLDVPSSPAVGADGTIYVGMTVLGSGTLVAFNPGGTIKWQVATDPYLTAISVAGDGTIYYGATVYGLENRASIYARNPDGSLKWRYDDPDGSYVRTPAAIGLGKRLYAGSLTGFFALGP